MKYRFLKNRRAKKQAVSAVVFLALLAAGWRYSLLGFFIPLCMIAGIGIGLFRGRKWCDWFCPRGSFLDTLAAKASPRRRIPSFLKGLPLRLAVIGLLMAVMTYQLVRRWPDPAAIGSYFIAMLTVTTILAVIGAMLLHPRAWCCVCPVGTLANLAGRGKYPLRIDSDRCVECGRCRQVCPIDISPFSFKGEGREKVRDGDCLKCGQCVAACPTEALRFRS